MRRRRINRFHANFTAFSSALEVAPRAGMLGGRKPEVLMPKKARRHDDARGLERLDTLHHLQRANRRASDLENGTSSRPPPAGG